MAGTSVEKLEEIWRLSVAQIRPEPLTFFKPNKKDPSRGVAAKFNLRLRPVWKADAEFVEEVEGGLFLDLVAQGPMKGEFPTFAWTDKNTLVTAKLGLKDVSSIRASIRDFRGRGVPIATYLRNRKDPKENQLSLFHQHESSGTTVINYQFEAESSFLSVSKRADLRRSVSLTLDEELALDAYLEQALKAFILVGLR